MHIVVLDQRVDALQTGLVIVFRRGIAGIAELLAVATRTGVILIGNLQRGEVRELTVGLSAKTAHKQRTRTASDTIIPTPHPKSSPSKPFPLSYEP